MPDRKISRRELLKTSAAVTLGFTIVPRHVLGGAGYTPPSEQITRAVIGTGDMGMNHVRYEFGKLVAVCDADSAHLKNALDEANGGGGTDVKGYRDFREVLQRTDIDVVHLPTPPHWHALMAIAAAESGKDVWGEKPMTRTIGEGLKVVKAIQRNSAMFRVNTWFRYQHDWYGSDMRVQQIKKLADSGLLGWPLKITISQKTGFNWKFDWSGQPGLNEQQIPPELDYDMWLGPAPYKPYNKDRVHLKFRGYWDYDGGGLGDMGQHYLDPAQYILGKDDTSPVEIEANAEQQHPDAVLPFRRIWMRYADGCELVLDGDPGKGREPLLEGPKGKLYAKYESNIPNLRKTLAAFPDPEPTVTDFAVSVKTRQPFSLNEKTSHRSCTLINLAKIAMRSHRKLRFDPENFRFVDDEQANLLIDEPMRGPWHL